MSVFNENNEENVTSPLAELVGEGRKYSSVEELAKAYKHADQAIEQRNRELAALRDELGRRLDTEELFNRLGQNRDPSPLDIPSRESTPPVEEPKSAPLDNEALAKRIREELERANNEQRIKTNLNSVESKLLEAYGDSQKALEVVKLKAQELGVSVEFLQSVAAQSPKAFLAQLGLDNTSNQAPAVAPRNDINPRALNETSGRVKEGTYAYYENIRKTDPKAYYSPKIQIEMHKKATELGRAFFE